MLRLHVSDHRPNYAKPMLNGSSSGSGSAVVDCDRHLNDAEALAIGFPQNLRTCTHVCLERINSGDRGPGVGSEAALSVRDLSAMSGAKVRELCDYTDSKLPVPWNPACLVPV